MSFLERAFRVRSKREDIQKAGEMLHPVTGEKMGLGEHDRTLRDVFSNEQESGLFLDSHFSAFALVNGKTENEKNTLAEKILKKEVLDSDEQKFLDDALKDYNQKRARYERVKEFLTPDEVKHIAANDPRIGQIVRQVGLDKAADFLRRDLESTVFEHTDTFNNIAAAMKATREIRMSKGAKKLEERMQAALSRADISGNKFEDIMAIADETERNKKLKTAVREQLNLITSWKTGGRMKELQRIFANQNDLLLGCDKESNKIAGFLHGTLSDSTKESVIRYALGGTDAGPEAKLGANDYREAKEKLTDQALEKRFREYKAAEEKKLRGTNVGRQITADETSGIIDRFATQEYALQQKYNKPRGLIAVLIGAILNSLTHKTRDGIKNHVVTL